MLASKIIEAKEAIQRAVGTWAFWWRGVVDSHSTESIFTLLFHRPLLRPSLGFSFSFSTMSDLFSAAAKPLYLPHEESLESRSIRKGRQTSHLKVQLPGRPESPSSSSDVDMSSSPINDSFLEMDSKEKDTLDAFPAPNVNATTPPPLAPSQGRLRRNSLGRQSLVAINNVARCASSESSLDDDIRCAVNRAVDQGSSNLDLA